MANAVHPPIHTLPVGHAPLGFDFGLSTSSAMVGGWPSTVTPGHTNSFAFQQLASSVHQASQHRVQKRRHEPEDDQGRHNNTRDDAMDRSPTPERVKKAAPKRARITSVIGNNRDVKSTKDSKASPDQSDDQDIDVGVLLGKRCFLFAPCVHFSFLSFSSEFATRITSTSSIFTFTHTTFPQVNYHIAHPSANP
jgi:hypothetical protein